MLTEEQMIGSYRVVSLIDVARYEVYRAVGSNGREVAIKVPGTYSTDIVDAVILAREFDVLQRIDHPNIVKAEDFLEDGYALVLEYLDGPNLDEYVESRGKLSERVTVEYARQAADALMYTHSLEPVVIHGDVKPKNIIVLPKRKIKLIDFGSSATPESFTEVYAPKEKINRKKSTSRSDVYSLGWTVYFCLSGKDPSLRKDESKTIMKKLRISKRLKQLLFSAVEDEEIYRPTAAEFLKELEAV